MKNIKYVLQNQIHVSIIMDNISIYIYEMTVLRYRSLINDVLKKFKYEMLRNHSVICKGIVVSFDASHFRYPIIFIVIF